MRMNKGITKENLLLVVPPALTHDPSMMALAAVDAEALAARPAEIDRARVIPNIDGLDEAVLDILARDFKVDWWDADYTLEEKRRTLKSSWRVHRTLGTKAAVETAIRAIYPGSCVEEWFEYGGEPYHFRLRVKAGGGDFDREKHRKVLLRMAWYKNLRSWMDTVAYEMPAVPLPEPFGTGALRRFAAFRFRIDVLARVVRLDGSRRLDGSWTLWQSIHGIGFPRAAFAFPPGLPEGERVRAGPLYGGGASARTWEGAALRRAGAGCAVWEPGNAGLRRAALRLSCQNPVGGGPGGLTRDSMWRLDGGAALDGRLKLNAAVTSERL